MRPALTTAWAVGIGIVSYRSVRDCKRPPMPGVLLVSSGLFVGLSILAEPAPELAVALAWGFVGAAWINLGNVASPRCPGAPGSPVSTEGAVPAGNSGPGPDGRRPI